MPLPIELSAAGLPGCWLRTSHALSLPVAVDAAGRGRVTLGIPAFPWQGGVFVGQFAALDAAANAAGWTTSDGVQAFVR